MVKKLSLKYIIRSSLLLVVLSILYVFPVSNNNIVINEKNNTMSFYHDIFLLNENDYVSKTTISVSSIENERLSKDLLNSLIIDGKNKNKIPNNFKGVIPKNTKIDNVKVENNHISVSFDDNIKKTKNKTKMIECIVYTLTSVGNINEVELLINNEKDDYFNKIYKRDIGVNKEYDISSFNDIKSVNIYYVSKNNNVSYYVPVTKVVNTKDNKINVIIKELTSSNVYQSGLISYLNSETKLINYEIMDNEIKLYFNDAILNKGDSKILEEVIQSISYSIKDSIGVSNVHIIVNDKEF